MRMKATIGLLSVSLAAGCGDIDSVGQDETPLEYETASTSEALLSGAADATSPHATGEAESETAAMVGAFGVPIIAYNNRDTAHVTFPSATDRKVCAGTQGIGFSYKASASPFVGWTKKKLAVPPGFATLWGDPAVARHAASETLFLSAVAAPTAKFNSAASPTDGCVHGPMDMAIQGACVARGAVTVVPIITGGSRKSVDFGVVPSRDCFGSEILDGGSLAAGTDFVYAAYLGFNSRKALVWRATPTGAFTQLPDPFPGLNIDGHPMLLPYATVYLLAADTSDRLLLTRFDEQTVSWTPPVVVTTGFDPELGLQLRNGRAIRQISVSADIGIIGFVTPQINIMFNVQSGNTVQLRGVSCRVDNMTCEPVPQWTTSATDNAFMPSVKFAKLPGTFGGNGIWKVTYWTDMGLTDGSVRLRQSTLDTGFASSFVLATPQFPCPDQRGYWGDYDNTYVQNDGTSSPIFRRSFADSTGAACSSQTFQANPQHVSVVGF